MNTAINSKNAFHVNYGGTNLTTVKENNVEIRRIGRTIFLRDSCYARTNHFIKETQPYSRAPLCRYWYFPCARWLFLACALVCLGSAWSVYVALPLAAVMLAWLVVLCQHCVVSGCTLPRVLSQPVVAGQQRLNQLYEVRVEELTGVLLQAHQAGLGYVEARTGLVKLQTLSPRAVGHMQRARIYSVIMLVVSLLLFLYATGSAGVLGWNKYTEDTNKNYCDSLRFDCVSCLNNTAKNISFWFLHYEVKCKFSMESSFTCTGICRTNREKGSHDESSYDQVSSCGSECREDARDWDCSTREIDKVCGKGG